MLLHLRWWCMLKDSTSDRFHRVASKKELTNHTCNGWSLFCCLSECLLESRWLPLITFVSTLCCKMYGWGGFLGCWLLLCIPVHGATCLLYCCYSVLSRLEPIRCWLTRWLPTHLFSHTTYEWNRTLKYVLIKNIFSFIYSVFQCAITILLREVKVGKRKFTCYWVVYCQNMYWPVYWK